MPEETSGFPYYLLHFDADGHLSEGVEGLVGEIATAGVTDLLLFSHGWNNDERIATELYTRFFAQLRQVLDDPRSHATAPTSLAVAGVIWPSMRWSDEAPEARAGGAASTSGQDAPSDGDQVRGLRAAFPDKDAELAELADLLEKRPKDIAALARFQTLVASLVDLDAAGDGHDEPVEDGGERALVVDDPEVVFARMAAAGPRRRSGGAQGIGDRFARLWDGAKDALRQATYWQMKKRAGTVGRQGLGPLLAELHRAAPELRCHLVGHSFGARLVSFTLDGLPEELDGGSSPVKSVSLLQGAFSHFAFAPQLPFDHDRPGALAGRNSRVDGPLLVSHSLRDTAVGRFYPMASLTGREDSAATDDQLYRWGAMGHDGAQAVGAQELSFQPVGSHYAWEKGAFVNLDGNQVIVDGGPPSGSHSDIVHEQIAWAILDAAGLVAG